MLFHHVVQLLDVHGALQLVADGALLPLVDHVALPLVFHGALLYDLHVLPLVSVTTLSASTILLSPVGLGFCVVPPCGPD